MTPDQYKPSKNIDLIEAYKKSLKHFTASKIILEENITVVKKAL